MLKIKSNNEEFKEKLNRYNDYVDESDYVYVITDEADLIEKDKLNIVIPNNCSNCYDLIDAVVSQTDFTVMLKKDGEHYQIPATTIDYFESIDNVVYAKCCGEFYSCNDKLYTLEQKLIKKKFLRVSKYCLVNSSMIKSMLPIVNFKLLLFMKNGDTIEVNRTYIKEFKDKMKLK